MTSGEMAVIESQVKQGMDEPAPLRLRHRILQAGGWAGSGFVLDKVIAAIQLMVVARLLTPADFGVMAASATIVLAFMTISELGLESALIAKAEVHREDLAVAWTVAIARGVAMAACLWATADVIGQAVVKRGPHRPRRTMQHDDGRPAAALHDMDRSAGEVDVVFGERRARAGGCHLVLSPPPTLRPVSPMPGFTM